MFRELLEHGGGSATEPPALLHRALANCMREDPMVALEMQRWWARGALQSVQTVDKKRLAVHEHAQLYQRLNFALATRAKREPQTTEAIAASAGRDWQRMREQQQVADYEAFTLGLYALVMAWNPPSSHLVSVSMASLLHELHDLAFVRYESISSPERPKSAKDVRSEKKEIPRPQRSNSELRRVSGVGSLLKSSASMRRLNVPINERTSPPIPIAVEEDATPQSQLKQRLLAHKAQSSRLLLNDHNGVPGLSNRFTRHLSSPLSLLLYSTQEKPPSMSSLSSTSELQSSSFPSSSSISGPEEDYASHFFSIETRLELKARLEELQTKLSPLLVQTKLAWMRCFADSGGTKGSLTQATELVERSEELTAHLLRAFNMATATTNCPIDEFQTLVERTERELASFQKLVHAIAVESRPSVQVQESGTSISGSIGRDRHHAETQDAAPVPYLRHPVSFDLPSMKTYCAKVAPPYASYTRK